MGAPRVATGPGDTVTVQASGRARPSNVTLKAIMAVTGTIFALFVFVHMVGNLKVFLGPEDYNAYAKFLRTLAYPLLPYEGALWIFRAVLLVCLVLHVWAGLTVWYRGRRARGGHGREGMAPLTWTARTMVLSGLVVFCFLVVHLLDLTIGAGVQSDRFHEPVKVGAAATAYQFSAYENLVASLSRPGMAIFYTLVMVIIAIHIAQGAYNTVHDFGMTGPRLRSVWFVVGLLIALSIVLANGAIPLLILSGVIS